MKKENFGTREWSVKTVNFIDGCKNNCKYCYAKGMGVRFKRTTPEQWENEVVREKDLMKKIPKYKGTVMFPSSHDITPEHLLESITVLKNILKSGNQVLVVSKPNMECISKICETFSDYMDNIMFRFSIGSSNSTILKYWETSAPSFEERLECLKLCHGLGYKTSVSSEPLLDKNVDDLINQVSPYITDTIWIGKPNQLLLRTRMNGHGDSETIVKCKELLGWINDSTFIHDLYNRYKDNPMIRWKSSISKDLNKLSKKFSF